MGSCTGIRRTPGRAVQRRQQLFQDDLGKGAGQTQTAMTSSPPGLGGRLAGVLGFSEIFTWLRVSILSACSLSGSRSISLSGEHSSALPPSGRGLGTNTCRNTKGAFAERISRVGSTSLPPRLGWDYTYLPTSVLFFLRLLGFHIPLISFQHLLAAGTFISLTSPDPWITDEEPKAETGE